MQRWVEPAARNAVSTNRPASGERVIRPRPRSGAASASCTPVGTDREAGRNDLCPGGSGKRFKRSCRRLEKFCPRLLLLGTDPARAVVGLSWFPGRRAPRQSDCRPFEPVLENSGRQQPPRCCPSGHISATAELAVVALVSPRGSSHVGP